MKSTISLSKRCSQALQGDLTSLKRSTLTAKLGQHAAEYLGRVIVFGYEQCLKIHNPAISGRTKFLLPASHRASGFAGRGPSEADALAAMAAGWRLVVHLGQNHVVVLVFCQQGRYHEVFRRPAAGSICLANCAYLAAYGATPHGCHTTPQANLYRGEEGSIRNPVARVTAKIGEWQNDNTW